MQNLIRDIRYGGRSLFRDPGFTFTVVLTLALCIGANTAAFAILHSVVLQPLPVPDAGEIVLIANRYPRAGVGDLNTSSVGDYYDRLAGVGSLREQALFRLMGEPVDNNGRAQQVQGMAVTPSFFKLVEIPTSRGRTFVPGEGEIGNEHKVVLSDALWRSLYGPDPSAIGRELRIGGKPFTVIGVMPPHFDFVDPKVRFWIPLAFDAETKAGHHNNNWYNIGRLKPGATIAQVQSQVDAINAVNLDRFPQMRQILINAGFHSVVEPLQHMIVKDVERILYLLWGGALFVLLIGTLNLINVALARSTIRRKEMATRLALGCDRGQLLRQFLAENILVTGTAGIVGIALGEALLRALTVFGFDQYPRAAEVHIDAVVTLAALGLSIGAGVVMAAAPLAGIASLRLADSLREGSRGRAAGIHMRRFRQALVGAEIGFAFVLLAGAGLLLTSFRNLMNADPGFTADRVLTASTHLAETTYPTDPSVNALVTRSLDSIRRLPGVASAGATSSIPFSGDYDQSAVAPEGYVTKPGESIVAPHHMSVTPGYFETMKISLLRGRFFEERDNASARPVIVIDDNLARRFWGDRDPVGQRMHELNGGSDPNLLSANTRWLTVIGVTAPIRLEDLAGTGNSVGLFYFSFAQVPERRFTFAVKAAGDVQTIESAVPREVARIDPEIALFDVRTMVDRAELSVSSRRASMTIAVGFGLLALFLSAIGIYGVLAYLITQRRREIGIRVALGSTGLGIIKLVLREGLLLVLSGLAIGMAATVALKNAVAGQVYGVRPLDPWVIGSVAFLLGSVAILACIVPARRAVRVDPIQVLNEQ